MLRFYVAILLSFYLSSCAVSNTYQPIRAANETLPDLPGCTAWPEPRKVGSSSMAFIKRISVVQNSVDFKNFEDAKVRFLDILETCKECSDIEKVQLYQTAGIVYYYTKEVENSTEFFKKALDFSKSMSVTTEASIAYAVAQNLLSLRKFDESIIYFDRWESLCPTEAKPEYFLNKAFAYHGAKQIDKSREWAGKAIKKKISMGKEHSKELRFLAYIEMTQGDISKGNYFLTQAHNLANQYQPIFFVQPDYPKEALSENIVGTCLVRFKIDVEGVPRETEIGQCSNKLFKPGALKAANQLRYDPQYIDGKVAELPNQSFTFVFSLPSDYDSKDE